MRVNQQRLWDSLMEMGKVGALSHGGSCRLALSAEDGAGRDLFVAWCKDAGCDIAIDQVGNIFARRRGKDENLPSIATGSHLDTQPHGGKFDGIYGVLAGLEVVRTLNDHEVETDAAIEIAVWTNEEAARFAPPLTGSSAFVGVISPDFVHSLQTVDGTYVGDDLKAIGYMGDEAPGDRQFDCFFEAHIEQGPVLEDQDILIGVVTKVQGLRFMTVRVEGQDGHAGTLPMDRRRDALVGASSMVVLLNELAHSMRPDARITVGSLVVSPNSGSTVPGHVQFTVDCRHPDKEILEQLQRDIKEALITQAERYGLAISIEENLAKEPVDFDAEMQALISQSASSLGLSHRSILSGAGHDAMNLAKVVPTGMIFIPCAGGISHNEAESATPEHLAAGADVLMLSMLARARKGYTA